MLERLKKKDITKITVSELAELADIGRGTFYLHYQDPYDLLEKLEDELLEPISTYTVRTASYGDKDSLLAYLQHIWQYLYENKETFQTLMNHRNRGGFMEKFKQYALKCAGVNFQTPALDPAQQYMITYLVSGSLGVFHQWMEDDAPIPPDELAQIVRNLISG